MGSHGHCVLDWRGVDGRALVLNKSNDMGRLREQSWDGSGLLFSRLLVAGAAADHDRGRGGITSSIDDVLAWRSSQRRGKSGENTVVAFARAGKLTRHPDCSQAKGMEKEEDGPGAEEAWTPCRGSALTRQRVLVPEDFLETAERRHEAGTPGDHPLSRHQMN